MSEEEEYSPEENIDEADWLPDEEYGTESIWPQDIDYPHDDDEDD